YSTDNVVHALRVQHFGPVGRRAFWRSRVQLFVSDTDAQSATETSTIRVLDAFTSGGAQRAGGDHSRTLNIASDLDYVLGRHSFRMRYSFENVEYRFRPGLRARAPFIPDRTCPRRQLVSLGRDGQ